MVFKIVERCNINCTYCYYFNMGDTTALQRPPVVSVDSATQIASWLADGCRELQIQELSISFHGGEPMMLNPDNFDAICSSFTDRLEQLVDLSFNIQTNGTILTDKWLSTLCRRRVHVGVSIDGGRAVHDRYRLDRQGRSTFEKTEKNLKTLVSRANESAGYLGPATISVLDCRNDYTEVYEYLRGLGVRRMSFLLPDRTLDDAFISSEESARRYGESLFQIFEAWMTEDDPGIYVRFVSEMLQKFQLREGGALGQSHDQHSPGASARKKWARQVVVIHSDGSVGVSDSYTPALSWYRRTPGCSIHDSSLREFLMNDIFDEIEKATVSLSAKCQSCEWKSICRGGDLENRYSKKNGFDNPSVYCEGYQWFFQKACDLLIRNGYPAERMRRVLVDCEVRRRKEAPDRIDIVDARPGAFVG
ncbi:MAG: radical SAM protein [Planctomycetes bacterium]|nr:radical SAM protein [Planctomycetota bacterium]